MNNQFIYSREVEKGKKEDGTADMVTVTDTLNLDFVIRSIGFEDGKRLVLLNDFHERLERVPQINPKTNKMTGTTKERNTYQSEIYLNKEDSERFLKLFK